MVVLFGTLPITPEDVFLAISWINEYMRALKSLIVRLVSSDIGWYLLKPFSLLGSFMLRVRNDGEQSRNVLEEQRFHEELSAKTFQERKVLYGPFKGLQYPSYNSIGSALYPKLLGSYERELHATIEELGQYEFSEILNIGCGEGYYAIGLARKFPNARVFGYDIDRHALRLCQQMAELNDVTGRILLKSELLASDLKGFRFTGTGLIVCDCEGFELDLFNTFNLENLKQCHLVIEIHDYIDINISSVLSELFLKTHSRRVIKSVDDIEKARTYVYPETEKLDLATKKKLFGECRPTIMEWFYLAPNAGFTNSL